MKGDAAELQGLISWLLLVKIQNSFLGDTKATAVILSFSCSNCCCGLDVLLFALLQGVAMHLVLHAAFVFFFILALKKLCSEDASG